MILKIGTRGSKLALAQSEWVRAKLETKDPDVRVKLVRIKTKGDKILDSPLSLIGGKGLFVKEIEDALLRQEIDAAVHSMKDVPSDLPDGLHIAVFPEREDPRDAYVSRDFKRFEDLPREASVGTSSLRRTAQLLNRRPDLHVVPLRGNVDTRLRRMESGDLQAVILAAAGLQRLDLSDRVNQFFAVDRMLPAIGQGALGIEIREDDHPVRDLLDFLNNKTTAVTVRAERAFLKRLEGGCQVPIAGHAQMEKEGIFIQGLVAELDGSRIIRDEARGRADDPETLGIRLAEDLLHAGAGEILKRIYENT